MPYQLVTAINQSVVNGRGWMQNIRVPCMTFVQKAVVTILNGFLKSNMITLSETEFDEMVKYVQERLLYGGKEAGEDEKGEKA